MTVSEELPLDVTILSVKPEKGECGDRVCRLGTLLTGETVEIEVTGVTDRDSGGRAIPNRVRVDARQRDLNPEDNVDGAIVRVKPKADVVVEKSAAAPTLAAGGIAQFLVVVRNDGPSTATDVVLKDIVPPGLQPLAFAPSQGTCEGNSCSLGTAGRRRRGGGPRVPPAVPGAGRPDVREPRASGRRGVRPQSRQQRGRRHDHADERPGGAGERRGHEDGRQPIVTVGDVVTFTVTAENQGPGTASSVMLSDGANPAVEVLSAEPSQGSCVIAKPTTCELGALAPGARATLVVRARVVAAGLLRNVAAVIFPESDPNPMDSLNLARVAVRANVGLRKRANRSSGAVRWTRDLHE